MGYTPPARRQVGPPTQFVARPSSRPAVTSLCTRSVDLSNAHFQHPVKPLEALVSPPVSNPRAMAWSGEELLVVDNEGTVHLVEPSYGARKLFRAAPNPVRIAISPSSTAGRRVAILDAAGLLRVYGLDGRLWWERLTGLIAGLQVTFEASGLVAVGDAGDARRALALDPDGGVLSRARVPARTVAVPQPTGLPWLVRSLSTGLQVLPWGVPLGSEAGTQHHLYVAPNCVFGVSSGGVTLWRGPRPKEHGVAQEAVTVKLLDVANAAVSLDGETLALATRSGGVSVTVARPGVVRPGSGGVTAHEAPVTGLGFSQRGRWLASLAERVWIWSY